MFSMVGSKERNRSAEGPMGEGWGGWAIRL